MDNKYSLPPGWGERSNQENPWANVKTNPPKPAESQPAPKAWATQANVQQPSETTGTHYSDAKPEPVLGKLQQTAKKLEGTLPKPDAISDKLKQVAASAKSAAEKVPRLHIAQEKAQSDEAAAQTESYPKNDKAQIQHMPVPKSVLQKAAESAPKATVFSSSDLDNELLPDYQNPNMNAEKENESEEDHISPLVILIPVAVVVLSFIAGLFFMKSKQPKQPAAEIAVAEIQNTDVKKTTVAETTEIDTTAPEPAEETEPKTEEQTDAQPDYEQITMTEYAAILAQIEDPMMSGYYEDIDGDVRKELILKDPVNMNFQMYQIADDGTVEHSFFGSFPSVSEVKLFRVQGNNDKCYLYWKCEYAYYSTQGYYDGRNSNEIDISIQFVEKAEQIKAKGSLRFNGSEENSGTEEVDSVYGATPKCKKALFSLFRKNDFQIDDSSDYKKMNELSADELKRLLSENN